MERYLQGFLGVNIDKRLDGSIHMSQPHLIDQIITDLRITDDNVKVKDTSIVSSKHL